MSFKDLVTRVVDAVAIATDATVHERAVFEEELLRDPRAFVGEWREYIPAELADELTAALQLDDD